MLHGKLVHLKKFPEGHQVKLFRLVSSTRVTEWIVTNNLLKLLTPKSQNRQRCAGRSSSFTANGNKPPEFNVVNAENKEPNAITLRPHCWLGPIFIRQQCVPKQRSTPSNRDYWMTTSANSSGIQLSQLLLRKSYSSYTLLEQVLMHRAFCIGDHRAKNQRRLSGISKRASISADLTRLSRPIRCSRFNCEKPRIMARKRLRFR